MPDRLIVGLALLFGFLWMRTRARSLRDSEASRRALLGIFLGLAPALVAEKWLFDHLPFERFANLAIELGALGVSFGATAFFFLRPGKATEDADGTAA